MKQTIVYVGFNAIILIQRAESLNMKRDTTSQGDGDGGGDYEGGGDNDGGGDYDGGD